MEALAHGAKNQSLAAIVPSGCAALAIWFPLVMFHHERMSASWATSTVFSPVGPTPVITRRATRAKVGVGVNPGGHQIVLGHTLARVTRGLRSQIAIQAGEPQEDRAQAILIPALRRRLLGSKPPPA